jgi:hypothetical protein
MLMTMTPPNKWRALLVVLVLGFWAGGAAAQSDDDSGWFDEPDTSERPQLKIHGQGQYDPPPPDFRNDSPEPGSLDRGQLDRGQVDPGPADVTDDVADDDYREDADSQQRAVGEFGPHLAPYGYWVDDPFYGRVWVPNRGVVGSDFRPYVSGGHWALTADDDWLWVSDYPFGWVTFHYGRWTWLSGGLGWGWVPGYTYSPAWVDFRVGSSGYVGWGPAPPYSVWRGGVFVSLGVRRPIPYIFCPTTYVFSAGLPRYVVYDRYRARSIASQTYRYRPRYVAGGSLRVRGPSPREARIPNRYVPTRRVIAQPRGTYVASAYRGRDSGVVRRDEGMRRYSGRGPSAPSESRYRAVERSRVEPPSRSRDSSPRRYVDPGASRSQVIQRGSRSAAPAPNGSYRQAQSAPPRATPRETRGRGDGGGRSDWGERRTEARGARGDGGRDRGGPRAQPSERRAPSAGGGDRRAAPARASSSSRGGSSGGNQQRSRRDNR